MFGGKQRRPHLLDIDHRLDDEIVDTGFCQRLHLFGVNVEHFIERQLAERPYQLAGRPEVAPHPHVRSARLSGQFDGGVIQRKDLAGQSVVGQFDPVRAKSAGGQHFGPCLHVTTVHGENRLGILYRPGIRRLSRL